MDLELPPHWNGSMIMADLSEAQKLEIVEALACFRDVPSIVRSFHLEHGIQLDRKQVGRYDPTRPYFAGREKWREIFEARRRAYLDDVGAVPVANRAFRLNELHDLYRLAKGAGNLVLAAQLLEHAAKETGGMFTNQRNLQVESTGYRPAYLDLTPVERRAKVTEMIRQSLERSCEAPQALESKAA